MWTWTTELLYSLPLLAVAVALATAGGDDPPKEGDKPPSEKGGGAGKTDLGKEPDKEGADKDEEEPSAVKMVELPEEDLLAYEKDKEELGRRRAENARLREQRKKDRQAARPAASGDDEPITAAGLAQILTEAIKAGRAPADETPSIPGLEVSTEGEVTYMGQAVEPALARLVTQAFKQASDTQGGLREIRDQLSRITQRLEAEDQQRAEAVLESADEELQQTEGRHIKRMEDYGLAICDATFAAETDGMQKVLRRAFYSELGEVFNALDERGVPPEDVTPKVVATVSERILTRMQADLRGAPAPGAKDKEKDAREKEPLKRGGTEAEPGRPDLSKMSPEEREKETARIAKELAESVGGVEGGSSADEGYLNY